MLLKKILILLFFCVLCTPIIAGEKILMGEYHGQDLYIQNPFNGTDYCITSIYVNGKKVENIPKNTAFVLDLSFLKEGDPVVVKIYHEDWGMPKVLNEVAIRALNSFQFVEVEVNNDIISWIGSGEKQYGKYFIMKYEHNSWVVEKVVEAKGNAGNNVYTESARHHSGENKYKIQYLEVTGKRFFSTEVEYVAESEKVSFYPKRVSNALNFTQKVKYEIMDVHAQVVKKGYGEEVDCSDLTTGVYYVSFDNRTEKFFKK